MKILVAVACDRVEMKIKKRKLCLCKITGLKSHTNTKIVIHIQKRRVNVLRNPFHTKQYHYVVPLLMCMFA